MQLAGNIKASSNKKIKNPQRVAQALSEIISSQTGIRVNVQVFVTPKIRGSKWQGSSQ